MEPWAVGMGPRTVQLLSVLHELNLRKTVLLGPRSVDQQGGYCGQSPKLSHIAKDWAPQITGHAPWTTGL